MTNAKFFIHLFVLLLIQLILLDNIQIHSYVCINLYILSIYVLPYRWSNVAILFFGFCLGMFVDLINHTMGVHTIATTLIAFMRPQMLLLTSNREQISDIQGRQKISEFAWFFKYIVINTLIFNSVFILCETFSFRNFPITLLRIVCSTLASIFFILLYYLIALKEKKN